MKHVTERPSFQGDLCIRRIDAVPAAAKPAAGTDGVHILAHSETGHHHVIDANRARLLIDETNAFIAWLDIASEAEIRHLRDFDTHETLTVTPGRYEVRRQREYVPEGFRRAAD